MRPVALRVVLASSGLIYRIL